MNSFPSEQADPVDLIDAVWTRLEHAQTIALMMTEQVERMNTDASLRQQLSAELSAVVRQIHEAQSMTEQLGQRVPLMTH